MDRLKEWFLERGRQLPWREDRSPYKVWVSEIMLQQTQVAVVIPYFNRWMERFPTLESLAHASIDEVIKLWEGLGYYSRARNIHRAAIQIVQDHQGKLPSQKETLAELPGFGPYTVGAVLSFAFHQRAAAVDGNVIRVLSRLFASTEDRTKKGHYESLTLSILPEEEPWVTMEALIELGAQVCQRQPKCQECPILEKCKAYRQGRVLDFPKTQKRPSSIYLKREVALITAQGSIVVRKETGNKIMSGLFEFPYASEGEALPLPLTLKKITDFPVVKHGFTRYNVTLLPTLYETEKQELDNGYEWRKIGDLQSLPFSSGHRRIIKDLYAYFTY